MRGNYYMNITLHFLYFHLNITMRASIMYQHNYKYMHYVPIIIYYVVVKMNSIHFNEYSYFWFDFTSIMNCPRVCPKQYWKSTTR